jgi:CheY-like chemotaxis protein
VSKKILVVEDEVIAQKAIGNVLEANGYSVVTASDGATATSLAVSHAPDLIILDLGLPTADPFAQQWDGFVVMDWLRRMTGDKKIPVIVLTACDPSQTQQRAFDAGAVAFFQKPADGDQLLATIRNALGETS